MTVSPPRPNGVPRADVWMQDLRYACRRLWQARGFSLASTLMLGLGIAGTTAMFALVQGVLLRPLPVRQQDRLVVAWKEARTSESARYPFGRTKIDAVARSSRQLVSAAGVDRNGVGREVLLRGAEAGYANVALVAGAFFQVLGVEPVLGRTLTVADDREGAENVIVISHGLWQRQFGGARDVIGRQVALGETSFAIVGVIPADLNFPAGVEIWRTTSSVPATGPFGDAARREVNLIGRLRDGVSLQQAASEIAALDAHVTASGETASRLVPVVRRFADVVVGDVRGRMLAMFAAAGLVLLIACANVANLLLLRGEARCAEIALRAALGAGRGRILLQVFAEALVLSTVAGMAGLGLAWASLQMLVTVVPGGLPRTESIHIDWWVVLFAAVVVLVTAVVASAVPAFHVLRRDLVSPLKHGALGIAGGSSRLGQRVLVVAQVALSVAVLAAAGVLIRSVLNIQAVELGVPADRLVLVDLHVPAARHDNRERHAQFLDEAIAQLEAVPGLAAATPINIAPFSDQGWDVPQFTAEGQDVDRAGANPTLNLESIYPNYFATFQIPLVRGRAFTVDDRDGAPEVAIVSADVAARVWPGQDPVGRRLKMGRAGDRSPWYTVVGVAGPTRYRTVMAARPTVYLPAAQFQMTATMLAIRSSAPLETLTAAVTERLGLAGPDVRVMRVVPFGDLLARPLARPRFSAFLLSVFGAVALLLSTLGLHAVMAAYVHRKHREIAVRVALGATAATIRRAVAGEAGRLAVIGVLVGTAVATATTNAARGLLFEVEPSDPLSLGLSGALLLCAATLASSIPVRRATRVDVVAALRQ